MTNHHHRRRAVLASLTAAILTPNLAAAAGFALIEANARGQGNAYAGAAANTLDASTIFFNPAGMTSFEGNNMVIAGHYILPDSTFNNQGSTAGPAWANTPFSSLNGEDDNGGANAVVPNFYYVRAIDEDSKFGIGINAPFGLATKYNDDWVGRYNAIISDLQIINFNPSYAYQVSDDFSVGVGVDFMVAHVNLSSAIDFGALCTANFGPTVCSDRGALPQQADGLADLEGDNFDDVAVGFNFGLTYAISPDSTLGFAYRSEVDIDVEGDADFTVPASVADFVFATGQFADTGLEAGITLPESLSLSYAHRVDRITYLADITWTGWSSFQELRINYDNENQDPTINDYSWEDVFRYSFGIDYQYSEETTYRIGLAYDESPVPSAERRTPRLPGTDRTWLSFGVSKQMDKDMSIDIGYSHLFIDDVEIDNQVEVSNPALEPVLGSTLTGEYEASVDIFSVQINWNF